MKYFYICLTAFALLFSGCGTKREYFEPKYINANMSYNNSLPSSISQVTRYGATLENGQIITESGLSDVKLEEGYTFLKSSNDKLLVVNDGGELRILDKSGDLIYKRVFSRSVVAADFFSNVLAVVDASNTLYLVNLKDDKIYFTSKQDRVYALSNKIASPVFVDSLVVFPTLDGKLVIVDWNKGIKLKDVTISSEKFFNNVIYLKVVGDQLVASTKFRVISISSKKSAFFNESIKDLIVGDGKIYVLSSDGRVLLLDENLKVVKEKKFLFAVFLGATNDSNLLIVEKNGHLISLDYDLENAKIYKLPDEIDNLIFMNKDKLFYKDRFTNLYE